MWFTSDKQARWKNEKKITYLSTIGENKAKRKREREREQEQERERAREREKARECLISE